MAADVLGPLDRTRVEGVKELLEEAYDCYARPAFIADDPVRIPRSFQARADAEVIGFLTATIAWGQRITIISNAKKLVHLMDGAPHDFILHATDTDLERLEGFVHRTFNGTDLRHFVYGLRHLYKDHGGLENAFLLDGRFSNAASAIARFKHRFFEPTHEPRTRKHVADPSKGSNAKRINMFLRWMVRPNDRGVDLGLWKRIKPAELMVPLDVHTGRIGRELGLLVRKQNDWRAVEELTAALRLIDAKDPIRFDIALFGLGLEAGSNRKVARG